MFSQWIVLQDPPRALKSGRDTDVGRASVASVTGNLQGHSDKPGRDQFGGSPLFVPPGRGFP